jgi:predicted permease
VESGFASVGVLDARILGFTGAVSLLSVLLVGLAPALWISRLDLNRLIREPQGRSGSVAKLHRAIIPVQVACSLALLVGAGLFLRTLQNLRAVDTGFDQRRVIQFSIDARSDGDWASRRTAGLPSTLLERLAALPGVESLTFYNRGGLLQERDNTNQPVTVTARDGVLPREALDVPTISVGPRFFDTMGISLVAGRSFGSSIAMFSRDAVLSASLARQLFGKEQDAVGRSVYLPSLALGVDETHRVIGVAEDVPYGSLRDSHVRTLYFGRPQASASSTSRFALRTHEDAAQLTPAIRAVVREFSVDFEVVDMRTLHDITEASIVGERLVARLTGILGLLALLLAAIGIYGVIAYAVTRRTGEIGLRMALGARAGHVVGMIVGQVMALVAAGLAFGVLGIGVFARLISRQLFGVTPYDVTTIAVALLLLASVCAAAAYLPVSRAANRIDPVVALREQ